MIFVFELSFCLPVKEHSPAVKLTSARVTRRSCLTTWAATAQRRRFWRVDTLAGASTTATATKMLGLFVSQVGRVLHKVQI